MQGKLARLAGFPLAFVPLKSQFINHQSREEKFVQLGERCHRERLAYAENVQPFITTSSDDDDVVDDVFSANFV
jgi:hypothetical protein